MEAEGAARARTAQQFIAAIPHARALGMEMLELGDGWALMALDWREDLVGDPETGVVHGGVVTALLDTCSGASVLAHASAPGSTATIDLRIDYMRGAAPGKRIFARAECYRITRSVAFVRGIAWTETPDEPVAAASGVFTAEAGRVEERRGEAGP